MPQVHLRKARKDYPDFGIKKGDPHYSWQVKGSPLRRSLAKPLPEQLTNSEFLQTWYPLNREVSGFDGNKDDLEDIIGRIRELGEDQQGKLSNMPDGLQQGPTGELLQERADECEDLASFLESCVDTLRGTPDGSEGHADIIDEIRSCAIA